jgi:hypothetical protein
MPQVQAGGGRAALPRCETPVAFFAHHEAERSERQEWQCGQACSPLVARKSRPPIAHGRLLTSAPAYAPSAELHLRPARELPARFAVLRLWPLGCAKGGHLYYPPFALPGRSCLYLECSFHVSAEAASCALPHVPERLYGSGGAGLSMHFRQSRLSPCSKTNNGLETWRPIVHALLVVLHLCLLHSAGKSGGDGLLPVQLTLQTRLR